MRQWGLSPVSLASLLPQELIFGAVRVADAPFVPHQRLVRRMATALQEHVNETNAGEVFGAPDLAIEILSPHPRIGQLDERVRWFAQYGVAEIWLYHQTEAKLHVLTCADGEVVSRHTFADDTPIQSKLLPQFQSTIRAVVSR